MLNFSSWEKMPPPGQATLWEDSVKVLCSGCIGKQIECFPVSQGCVRLLPEKQGTPGPLWKQHTGPGSPELGNTRALQFYIIKHSQK